jgi:carboxyl-terminal processing protease
MKKHFRTAVFVVGLMLLGAFLGGRQAGRVSALDKENYEGIELLTNIMAIVKKNYVVEPSTKDLIEGAVNGMLSSLDPHSTYLTPELYKELQMDTQGRFGGLGIEITVRDGVITVVSPIEDTPAYKAGVKAGDRILKIEEEFTKDMTLMDAVRRMRGPKGTQVTISVKREGSEELISFTLVRDVIKVQSVKSRSLEKGYGYVRLSQFQEQSGEDLKRALDRLEKENGRLNGLVLDLRNNPGGLLEQAVRVADEFLESGLIVYTDGRQEGQRIKRYAHKAGTQSNFPMVVLVNEGSASASEIVAGALQDQKRAVIMGTRTFGKGSVQTILPLDGNSALRLTTARYYTPNGRSIQGTGIVPDILTEPPAPAPAEQQKPGAAPRSRLREENLPGHLKNDQAGKEEQEGGAKATEEDPQIKRALDLLKSWTVFKHTEKEAA